MANNFIQVAPDSTGKMLQTYMNTIGGNQVHAEAITLTDNTGNYVATLPVSIGSNLNVNGTVAATQSGTWNVGTVTTLPSNSSFNLSQIVGTTADTNTGNATNGTLRVVLASNQPNVTVAGTITANAGSNLNTSALALESGGNLATLAGGVTASKYQANIAQIAGATPVNAGQSGSLAVGGTTSNASNVSLATNPLLIAGSDYAATPKVQNAKVDSTGGLYMTVLGSPTVVQSNASNFLATVSGTVAATQSGSWNVGTREIPDSTSTYAPSSAGSTAYSSNIVVKNSAGVLFNLTGFNSKATSQYILIFNSASLLGDGNAPNYPALNVPAGQTFSLDFGGKFGRYFSTGIVICNSSTANTKTIGSSDCWFDALYS